MFDIIDLEGNILVCTMHIKSDSYLSFDFMNNTVNTNWVGLLAVFKQRATINNILRKI